MPSAFPAAKMFHRTEMENYKLQVEMLQEKLQRSEEKRKQMEDQYIKIQKKRIEHEKSLKTRTRAKFEQFLNEQQTRNERNKGIIKMMDKIDEQTAVLQSRSEKLKIMKQQYEFYFGKLLQHQALTHSPRYTILPLTQQPSPAPQFLPAQNALNYYPSNLQNSATYQIGLQSQPGIANNPPILSTNQIMTTTSTTPTTTSISSNSYPPVQHPTLITNPNDFIYRYPMNPYDYYNNQIILNQHQLFQQQMQALQQPTMLQIPIQQHQIPPLPLGIPLRTGGVIPIVSPSTNSLIKPSFDNESVYPQANYVKQEQEKKENEFEKSNKVISSDFKYKSNNSNDDNKKNSTKSYLDNYDIRQHKYHSLDEFQVTKEKQRHADIYDDYRSRQQYQGNKNNDDEDDDDDEIDDKDSLQQSPKSKSIRKSTDKNIDNDNDYLLKKDWNKKKIPDNEDDLNMKPLPFNNEKTTPINRSVHLTEESKYSVNPNTPKDRSKKNILDENFAEISLQERQPIDITKYPDGYYLHQEDKAASQLPSHMWNFSGRIANEKPETPLTDPSKFEKKEKLSIENIENAMYGELIDPALSDINDITQLELKTANPMRPEFLRAKLTDFKEVIEPAGYIAKSLDIDKIPSPIHAVNMKNIQPPLNKEKPAEYNNAEIKSNYENVKYNAPIPELMQRQSVDSSSLSQLKKSDELDVYQPGLNQKLSVDLNNVEGKINDQIPQYEPSEYENYDQTQYDQTQYDQSQYEQPSQFSNEPPPQQYTENYNDQLQIQYDDQQQDYQYPAEQTQDYTDPDYQNYDTQQFAEGYDPNQYPQYTYDQTDPNYQQDPNQQYSETYDQQAYKPDEMYQQEVDYQNYEQTGVTDQPITSDQAPVQTLEPDLNLANQSIHPADALVGSQDVAQEIPVAPAVVSPKQSVKERSGTVKPILSKEKSVDSENKKKKRVNFIDSSDESSAAQKPEAVANESDFDFSSSN